MKEKIKIEKTKTQKLFSFLVFVALALTFYTNTVSAYTITKLDLENNEDFVVEPGKTEIFLNPGETVTKNISVTNRTNRPLDFNVSVENFVGTDDPETSVVLLPVGSETPYPLDDYIDFEIDKFTLNFGEKMTFNVRITVPKDIAPGGHYGAVIISSQSKGLIDEAGNEIRTGTQAISRIGSLILMRINGDVLESGSLKDFKISGPKSWFYQKMPTSFEVVFKNDGSVHLVPYGQIKIKNLFGSVIAQVPVDAYFVLPEATRYQFIDWPGKKFSFGYYKAELELYKGYGNQFDNKKINFFVFPLIIVIPVIVFIFLSILIIYFIFKKYEIKRK